VRAEIEARDAESERLIGWVQLAIAAVIALLYALARKPADAGMGAIPPVPAALLLYSAFTVVRLVLAHRGRLPGKVLALSILADVALLLGLIWAFHIQYGQPAAFSLKVPTFIYLFVVIALRALRFAPRWVLMAGAAAALGWAGMTLLALNVSGPGVVTRNFAHYLSGNAILIGAEVDKILVLLLVTLVLALAVRRAQATLTSAVREETAGREVGRFLPLGVPEAIATSQLPVEAGKAETRAAAIVMLDVRGFTRLSTRLPPEEVVRLLTGLHARIVPIVRRHGGVIDKFLGDGVMATFGAVRPSAVAAADAVRALEEIMAEAASWRAATEREGISVPLDVNGALAAGPVVFAMLGNAQRLEATVIGEAVNLAAKLEKHNKAAGTRALVAAEAYRLALAQGYRPPAPPYEQRAGARIAGVELPVDLVVLAG
jgi:adenylate cyclase